MSSESRYIKIKKRLKHKEHIISDDDKKDSVSLDINSSETIGPRIFQNILSSRKTLFLSLLTFRVFNSFVNQTQSVPDEYWQSVEVAHKWAFDIGYLTWEWLPETAIRSSIYPLMFYVPFKILKWFQLDNRILLIKLPGILHAILASIADYYLYLLSFRQGGQKVAQWALFNQLINWFTFYSSTRTLANTMEWFIVTVSLHEYQLIKDSNRRILSRRFLFLVCLCFVMRPTGLVILLPIIVYHFVSLANSNGPVIGALYRTAVNGVLVSVFLVTLSLLADKHFYGRWTCSQWNFVNFNLLTDVSHNYGVHPWHWYLSNAVPAIFLTQLPLLLISVWSEFKEAHCRHMIGLSLLVLYVYSCLGHKEFRFIFPLMPMGMVLLGRLFSRCQGQRRRAMVMFLVVSQVPMALYMSLLHQRGGLDTVMALGRYLDRDQTLAARTQIVFLMPCHSTPWSSHWHHNVSARFLTCDPQVTGGIGAFGAGLRGHDEADAFYDGPERWTRSEYDNERARPTFWVMFEQLSPQMTGLMAEWGYRPCQRFFHAHWPTHRYHSSLIVVFCARGFEFE